MHSPSRRGRCWARTPRSRPLASTKTVSKPVGSPSSTARRNCASTLLVHLAYTVNDPFTMVNRSVVEWKLDIHGCAGATGALNGDRAAERLDAVFQADEARASCRIGPAGAVIADGEPKHTVDRLHVDMDDRSMRVLGRICECLRDHEVRRHLDAFRQPCFDSHVEHDGNQRAASERLQRRPEAALG